MARAAAQGFAQSCGGSVDEVIHLETDKGTWLGYRYEQPGETVTALLPDIVAKAIAALPVPKNMRWGASRVEFSRPVHWLVALYGNEVIAAEALGLQASRTTGVAVQPNPLGEPSKTHRPTIPA